MIAKPQRLALRLHFAWGIALLALVLASPVEAVFHLSLVSEIMASYDDDGSVQFVEIEMSASNQNQIVNAVIAVFDADGNFTTDAIVFPMNVTNFASGTRTIVGTPSFETVSGLTTDFTMAAVLPTDGGMVCYGGGGGIVMALDPSWERTDLDNYVDCLAYGSYSGPTKVESGTPTPLLPVGHSLTRLSDTDDNEADFDCGDPATPTRNDGASVSLDATVAFCPEPEIAFAQLAALASLAWLDRRHRRARCLDLRVLGAPNGLRGAVAQHSSGTRSAGLAPPGDSVAPVP